MFYGADGNIGLVFVQPPNIRLPFGFGLLDTDMGLVHLGRCEYDPTLGRFIQPDPLGYAGGDEDGYGYCP